MLVEVTMLTSACRYGDEKGACEMLFSYGFIEGGLEDARDIFLDLEIPDDDPLKRAKKVASQCAPGVRISNYAHSLHWESEFVWIICANEEDGLAFRVAESIEGDRTLEMTWKEKPIESTSELMSCCKADPLWEVFNLRAVSIIQDRVAQQLQILYSIPDESADANVTPSVRDGPRIQALKLRELETELLERAYAYLYEEVRA
jgi:hypothetical protein